MTLAIAKSYIGKEVQVEFRDRLGNPSVARGTLLEVEYVPMYGSNLVFDFGEVGLDRVVELGDTVVAKKAA